ncbi:MAG: hypothetical protein JST43_11110 [Bacteroidetes bacterium]|nr:hypothetical protein [Bacteroidota bacterium]MBS1540068.1 hypothetical protein [Bacteroidota bacterium]
MKKSLFLVAVVALCSFTSPDKEKQFQYTFKKGDVYEITQMSMVTQHIVVAGMDQNIETNIQGGMRMKTIELIGNSGKFEIEFTSLSLKMKSPGMDMNSDGDTTNQANKMMGKAIRLMVGKKFNFTLTKNGVVESVENTENLWSGMEGKDPAMAQMKASLEQSFGKSSLKRSFEGMFVLYPENKIKTGSTWKNTAPTGNGMLPTEVANEYTLQSVTEPTATIVSDGQIFTSDSTKVISLQQGLRATASLKGRQVIKTTVSAASGWPEVSKSYSEVKGKMILLAGGQIPEDMPMQMEIKTEGEYTLKKK